MVESARQVRVGQAQNKSPTYGEAQFSLPSRRNEIFLAAKMANRHGLIAGATGTGKTVTLQTLAENFSARGVPVFMADVKGDLAGISQPGGNDPKIVDARKS